MGRHADRRPDGSVHGPEASWSLSLGRGALLVVALALAAVGSARAAPPSVELEALTWTELSDAIKAGATTIIIPAGGTEQSGPHMALASTKSRAACRRTPSPR